MRASSLRSGSSYPPNQFRINEIWLKPRGKSRKLFERVLEKIGTFQLREEEGPDCCRLFVNTLNRRVNMAISAIKMLCKRGRIWVDVGNVVTRLPHKQPIPQVGTNFTALWSTTRTEIMCTLRCKYLQQLISWKNYNDDTIIIKNQKSNKINVVALKRRSRNCANGNGQGIYPY